MSTILSACSTPSRQAPAATGGRPDLWPQRQAAPADPALKARIDALLARMSVEEKVGQLVQAEIHSITPEEAARYHVGSILNGGGSWPGRRADATVQDWVDLADAFWVASMNKAEGVPIPIMWGTDAVHGHGNVRGATLFPHNIGLGAADDPELVRRIGEVTAREVAATAIDWIFAPAVSVAQDDRWGRTYESFSEDPERVRRLAAAFVEGVQGRVGTASFLDPEHVIACAKHFIADGGTENGDDQGDARIDEAELVRVHAAGYLGALDAGVQTIMASFSSWNGEKMHGHRYLLTDILKGRLAFDGFVVGDWNGHGQVPGCTNASCPWAIEAGVDMIMVPTHWKAFWHNTVRQVKEGHIDPARLDDAVRRILRVKLRAGLFDRRPSQRPLAGRAELIGHAEHRALARRAVRQSLVLLKNAGGVLPIDPRGHVLVAGEGADDVGMQAGGWSVNWQGARGNEHFPGATSIFAGIREAVEAAGGSVELAVDGRWRRRPDVAVVVFGEPPYAEGRGDLKTLEFEPGRRKKALHLLRALKAQGIPVVSVFLSGRPLWVNPELNASDAFVAAWWPGSEGAGVADLLIADAQGRPRYDFTGRLPFSWPATPLQGRLNPHHPDYAPLFPLGYGLSYAGGEVGPGRLPEDVPGLASTEVEDLDLYRAGRPLEPWKLFLRDAAGSQMLSGAYAALPDEVLVVETIDRRLQGDALALRWKGAREVGLYLAQGDPLDIEPYLDGLLIFDVAVDVAPAGSVALVTVAGQDAARITPLNDLLAPLVGQGWQTLRLPLRCLVTDGQTRLSVPFGLALEGDGGMALGDIRLVRSGVPTHTCAALARAPS